MKDGSGCLLSLAPCWMPVLAAASRQCSLGPGAWGAGEAAGSLPGLRGGRGKQRAATAGLAVQGARMWGLCLQGGERLLALLLRA